MNLRDTVKAVIDDAVNMDIYSLTTLTLAAVPAEDRAHCFEQALPAFIRAMICETRIAARLAPTTSPAPAKDGSTPMYVSPEQGSTTSRKVAAIRDHWQRQLDAIYSTSDGNKRLRDFTYDDLMDLADTCADLARANAIKAERWKSLASLVSASGVDTLGDVPADVLAPAMGGVAA